MAVCWSFVMVLLLTLTVLVTPSQPLFPPPPGARENSKAVAENQMPCSAVLGCADVKRIDSWNLLLGRRGRFRLLFQRGSDFVCDQQLNCKRTELIGGSAPPALDPESSQAREILANYRLPQRPASTRFQSERAVPTGPNPLHNSNRSEVILP